MDGHTSRQSRYRDLISLHVAVLLFGGAGLFGKWIPLSAWVIVFGRVLFASLILGGILGVQRKFHPFPLKRKMLFQLAFSGALLAFHWYSFFRSIQLSTVAIGLLCFASFPVFTSLLEPWLFRERFEWKYLGLAILTAAGLYLAVPSLEPGSGWLEGVVWGILSGASFALLTLLNRQKVLQISAIQLSFYQDLFAMIFLLPLVLSQVEKIGWKEVGALFLLGSVFTALAHFLYNRSLRTVHARAASLLVMLEPVYGIALAAWWLKEIPGWNTIAGGLVILATAAYTSYTLNRSG